MSDPMSRALSCPIAPLERSHKRIFRSSITLRKRNVEWAGPITARIRGSVRNGRHLLRTGEIASSRNEVVHLLYVFSKKSRTAGFLTLRKISARYASFVRKGGKFQ